MTQSVGIIGGGLAGISSAVFLNEKGFDVSLFEASPKLGGRTYSWYDNDSGQYLDNGQHILAGWYENTFDFLNIIGSSDLIEIKKNLEIDFLNTEKGQFKLYCPDVFTPLNIFLGLLKFKGFGLKDKFSILKLRKLIKANSGLLKYDNAKEILINIGQTENLFKYFWNQFIYAVFNTSAENVSAKIFTDMIKKGLETKFSSALLIPKTDLNELFINPSENYFKQNSVKFKKNTRINKILIENEKVKSLVLENGNEMFFDYYVSAVPFYSFNKLFAFDDFNKYFVDTGGLKSSTIISVHIFFENDINYCFKELSEKLMIGLIGTTAQWIFLKGVKHLSIVISGADVLKNNISEMNNEDIFNICKADLAKCIDGFEKIKISGYKVIKEKRATFIPDTESFKYRISCTCGFKNFFVAGDWTDTGLPSMIESAIYSSKKCVNAIIK